MIERRGRVAESNPPARRASYSRGRLHAEVSVARAASIDPAQRARRHGRDALVLASSAYSPGRYTVSWDGRTAHGALSPGLYFLHFVTPERTLVRRVAVTH